MFKKSFIRKPVIVFRHFDGKSYSAFRSMHREIRIGVLVVSTLLMAHTQAKATEAFVAARDSESVALAPEVNLDETVITGSQLPVSMNGAWSKIVVITRQEIEKAQCQSVNDVLKLCPEVDVRQRGALGVQTDISMGGGTFDQVTILLNGINICSPQTGHLSADFPVAVTDIERIEVLNGASARGFGNQSLNGIINIITKSSGERDLTLHAESGSYGLLGGGAGLSLGTKGVNNRISSDYLRTDGAVDNGELDRIRLFYSGRYTDNFMRLRWQASYSNQRYGANTFYSAKYNNQWEENQRYMAALTADSRQGRIKLHGAASFIRNYDHFQLIKDQETGENYHRSDVLSLRMSANSQWALGLTALGAELRHEGILSTNLGRPLSEDDYVRIEHEDGKYYDHRDSRTNMSLFMEHGLVWRTLSINAGLTLNRNSAVDDKFRIYPGLDIGWQMTKNLKIFASLNRSMRMPTFTDLYYQSPTNEGNVGLKPEKSWTYKLGADYQNSWFRASLYGILRRGSNMIDWVMYSADDIYHSTAFKLTNHQLVVSTAIDFTHLWPQQKVLRNLTLAYVYNHQKRHDSQQIYQSNYALDYLRHKVTASLEHTIWGPITASWYLRWQERLGSFLAYDQGEAHKQSYKPYTMIDLKLRYLQPRYEIYASLENLLCRRYYDLGSVRQPGFTFVVGARVKLL